MAIPTILQGDSSGGVAITLAEGHNYEGATLVVVFNGVTREFTNLTAGGEVSLAFTADETANMPLGAGLVLMRLIGPTGAVETVGNADARIKVTDCVAEVNAGGSFAVTPGGNPLDGVEGLGTRYTGDQLRAKINEVIVKLGGTVAALLLCALPCLGGALDVKTAPFGDVYNDSPVVTNVELDVHVLTNGWRFGSDVDLTEATNYTDRALGSFAATGTVARAGSYGTPNRWVDATGCVWEVVISFEPWTMTYHTGWTDEQISYWVGPYWWQEGGPDPEMHDGNGWYIEPMATPVCIGRSETALALEYTEGDWIAHWEREMVAPTNLVGRVALTNDIPDVSGYATTSELNGAISTNNPAFVAAVTNCPVVIASGGGGGDGFPAGDWSDYGTLGALLAAIVAAITWLKNNQRYALYTVTLTNGAGTLLDRAGNRVVVSGDTTLTLPAAVAGYLRDFLVRLEISGSTVPTITFAAPTGETITYETDGDEFPVPDEAGTWLYAFTETDASKFAVALKSVSTVAAPTQGGS